MSVATESPVFVAFSDAMEQMSGEGRFPDEAGGEMDGQFGGQLDGRFSSGIAEAALSVPARLIEYASGCWIALPLHAALEVLEPAPVVQVPGSLPGWRGLLRWRGHWVPVLDPSEMIGASDGGADRHFLVLGWRPAPGEPFRYGAVTLITMPVTVQISDDMQCPLPADNGFWRSVALSCVSHAGRAVPIVDPARLFGARAWEGARPFNQPG